MHTFSPSVCPPLSLFLFFSLSLSHTHMHAYTYNHSHTLRGRAFAHGAVGRRIDPSWGGPIELFLVPASAPRLV